MDKLDCHKIENFCLSGYTLKEMSTQAKNWEIIFIKYIPDKGLLYRIYNNPYIFNKFLQINNKKRNKLMKKRAKDRSRHFTKGP